MAIKLGFITGEEREGIWIGDDSLQNVPEHVRKEWEKDGAAAHLRPYVVSGKPTVFKFRPLTTPEGRHARRYAGNIELVTYEAFRLGVTFPGIKEVGDIQSGEKIPVMDEDDAGFVGLSEPFMKYLDRLYPSKGKTFGIIDRYGSHVIAATFPSEPEKKASSPGSTEKPSSAEGDTKASTGEPNAAAEPAA